MSIFNVLTPDRLKATVLLGVDVTLDNGQPYPDILFDASLRQAVKWMEHELGIAIDSFFVEDEEHDGNEKLREAWWPFDLDRRPVWALQEARIQYGNYPMVKLPVDWLQMPNNIHGKVQLVPTTTKLGAYFYRMGIPLLTGDAFQPQSFVPAYFRFSYLAGFPYFEGQAVIPEGETEVKVDFELPSSPNEEYPDPTGPACYSADYTPNAELVEDSEFGVTTIGYASRRRGGFTILADQAPSGGDALVNWYVLTVPDDMLHAIMLKAAMLPLDVAGDLILGAGVASFATGQDGIHYSMNSTASATNSGYGARVLQFERELKALMPALRGRYRKPGVFFI